MTKKLKRWFIAFLIPMLLVNCAKGESSSKADVATSSGDTIKAKYTDYGSMIVKETTSGLIWKKCAQGQTNDSNCSGTAGDYKYCTAVDNSCNGSLDNGTLASGGANDAYTVCNLINSNPAGGYGGISNWRVPTKTELINFTLESRATEFSSLFPNRATGDYWSANSYISSNAYAVDSDGSSFGTGKDASIHVRCVASGH